MRPEDLKSPFSWKERTIAIHDRIWYVPSHYYDYDSFAFPGWTHPEIFPRENPVKIEYCSGNGAWIAAKAIEEPNVNWVAVDLNFERVRKIWSKVKNHRLENLFIVCGEGYTLTHRYIPSNSVQEVFINFPDPWPKNKHAKNRIVQQPFVQEINRILNPEGTLTLVTDDKDYSSLMIKVMQKSEGFESAYPSPYYVHEHNGYGTSYFEDMWRQQGKQIYYHQFRKGS